MRVQNINLNLSRPDSKTNLPNRNNFASRSSFISFRGADTVEIKAKKQLPSSPIISKDEFVRLAKEFDNTSELDTEVYCVGKDFENVKTGKFRANLHTHTNNSDGVASVKELLDQAAAYADKIADINSRTGETAPFIIGITDHDTVKGLEEVNELISKNPDKYKNLKIIPGVEVTTAIKGITPLEGHLKDWEVHTLVYFIDPKTSPLAKELNFRQEKRKLLASNFLKLMNKKYPGYNFDIEEAKGLWPSVTKFLDAPRGELKDYMQFKMIWTKCIDEPQTFKKLGIDKSALNLITPKQLMTYRNIGTFYECYYDKLKELVYQKAKEKNPDIKYSQVESLMGRIPTSVYDVSTSFDSDYKTSFNPKNLDLDKRMNFNDLIALTKKDKNTILGIAHPGWIGLIRNRSKMSEYLEYFQEQNKGKEVFAEGFYHENKKIFDLLDRVEYRKFINQELDRLGYIKTGSYDSHANNIFTAGGENYLTTEQINELVT